MVLVKVCSASHEPSVPALPASMASVVDFESFTFQHHKFQRQVEDIPSYEVTVGISLLLWPAAVSQ